MSGAISSLKVNKEQWVEATQNSYAVAVDLAEDLTAKGIPFRQSHKIVGELVRELVESKSRMKDIKPELVSSLSEKIIGKKLNLTDTELSRIIDPIHSLEARQSLGSPSQKEVNRMLQDRENKVEEYADVVRSRTEKLGEANSRLKRTVDEYISS
jgi:argininosuccinate lyase